MKFPKMLFFASAVAAGALSAPAFDFCGDRGPDAVTLDGKPAGAAVSIDAEGRVFLQTSSPASKVELLWNVDLSDVRKIYGGDWERTYGSSGWHNPSVRRPLPWYCLVNGADRTDGYGVEVQPAAFAAWYAGTDSLRLVLDVRAGRRPVRLGGRKLEVCRIVARKGRAGESAFEAGRAFCRTMCPNPRLPREPVYGYNDWYCAYGRNSADGFLADFAEIVKLCDGLENRPFAVVDDGWQLSAERCGDVGGVKNEDQWGGVNAAWKMPMDEFCRRIKEMGARPGLWYRPFYDCESAVNRKNGMDPTSPRVEKQIRGDMARFKKWGMELVKIDFITHDWSKRWNFGSQAYPSPLDVVSIDWQDDSRTAAETVRGLYRTMREAAGDDMYIIGCNAIDHFAAGLFELQRVGDDTSGREWGRTRKMGPNALAARSIHNNIFYFNDGDCVGLTRKGAIPWRRNAQWLDLVARSGTSLFVSWKRELLDDTVRDAMREAFRLASRPQKTGEPLDWMQTKRSARWRFETGEKRYDWGGKAK